MAGGVGNLALLGQRQAEDDAVGVAAVAQREKAALNVLKLIEPGVFFADVHAFGFYIIAKLRTFRRTAKAVAVFLLQDGLFPPRILTENN